MSSSSYRPDIDGLRALAVSIVVAFHVGLPWIAGGFVGVDIFFVISGFLICAIIHRDIQAGEFSFAAFYARRAKRILPALFLVLACCYALATVVLTGTEMNDFSRSAVANIMAVSNIYFWKSSNYFSSAAELKPLMMTWSLSVEEQFYLFFPMVLLVLKRFKIALLPTVVILTLLSFAMSIWLTGRNPTTAFFSLPTRAWELGVGALLAIQQSRNTVSPSVFNVGRRSENMMALAGAALLAFAVLRFDGGTAFPGMAAAVPVLGAALILSAPNSYFNRLVLSWRPVVFVGLVSYSWYLWHWPLLSFARLTSDRTVPLTTTVALGGIAFLLAVLSWRFVERPFRHTRHSNGATLWRYAAATMVMVTCGVSLIASNGWPGRFSTEFVSMEQSGIHEIDPCLAPYGTNDPNRSANCAAGSNGPAIALIGDSHSAALAPAFRALAREEKLNFYEYTKSSCPTLDGVTRLMPTHPLHAAECLRFNNRALALVIDNKAIKTVVLAGYWSSTVFPGSSFRYINATQSGDTVSPAESWTNLEQGLDRTVKLLHAAGKKVVLVQDVPIFAFDPLRSIALTDIPARQRIATLLDLPSAGDGRTAPQAGLDNAKDPSRAVIAAVAVSNPGVVLFDPWAALCQSERCRYSDGKELYYIDSQHLSLAGAKITLHSAGFDQLISE